MKRSHVDDLLCARPGGRCERWASALRDRHPVVAALVVDAVGYVVLASVMVLAGLLLTDVLRPARFGFLDHSVTDWVVGGRTGSLTTLSDVGSRLADTITAPLLSAIAVGVLLLKKAWRHAGAVATPIALEGLLYLTVTSIITRQRPPGVQLEALPPDAAYPSGHTAAAVAVYGALAVVIVSRTDRGWVRAAAWTMAAVVPLVVAVSRIYRGEHWFTDVVAGMLMGTGCVVVGVVSVRVAGAVARSQRTALAVTRHAREVGVAP